MGLDWRNIEDELKAVRETLLRDGKLSPRARAKLIADAMVHDPGAKDVAHSPRTSPRTGNMWQNSAGARGVKNSPRSDDASTELLSTTATDGWPQEQSRMHRRGMHEGGEQN